MPWRAPSDASIPASPDTDGPSGRAPATHAVEIKPGPEFPPSSSSNNHTPETEKAGRPLHPSVSTTKQDHLDHGHGQGPDPIGVPDGGFRAWLVVFGGFLDFMVAFGLLNSFGVFQARYEAKWPELGTTMITWIGSTQVFVFFAGGMFVGPAFDKYGSRALMQLGTACCITSFIATSWSTRYWHYLLAQGALFGVGNALLFYPVTGAISEWFDKRRGLALGLAASGSSAGGIFWPLLLDFLFRDLSEETVHRIIALISAPLLLLSCFLVRERKEVTGRDKPGTPARPSRTSAWSAVFERRFIALSACLMVLYCGMLVPFYFVPSYAKDFGVDDSMAHNLLAVTYTGSFFGRIGAGWLGDRFGSFNMLSLTGTIMSVLTFCWIWMTSLGAMVTFAILFGLFSSGLVPLGSACVAQTTSDMGQIGLRMGVMMVFASIGALSGGPLSGILRDGPTGWVGVHSFSAGMALTGTLLLFGVRLWHRPRLWERF